MIVLTTMVSAKVSLARIS